ncbi:MAG: dephospho-CoA kinase [Pirellulales bacterium]
MRVATHHPRTSLILCAVVGLLGGIASGKSHVARLLVARGAVWLNADEAGHDVLREPDVKRLLVERWGPTILDESGEVDRRMVAAIVFAKTPSGANELAWLESVSHPRIRAKLEQRIAKLRNGPTPVAVLDAPVMLKSGWDRLCDLVIFVNAREDVRLERAIKRGWTAEEFAAREASQEPLSVKRRERKSNWIIPVIRIILKSKWNGFGRD